MAIKMRIETELLLIEDDFNGRKTWGAWVDNGYGEGYSRSAAIKLAVCENESLDGDVLPGRQNNGMTYGEKKEHIEERMMWGGYKGVCGVAL